MATKNETRMVTYQGVLDHELFGEIRFVEFNFSHEPWFVAVDVCKVLGLNNVSQALSRLDDDEKGSIILNEGTSPKGGSPIRAIVNEPGLYRLIFISRKPEAKKIKRVVFHEILPSIRKHGYYVAPKDSLIRVKGKDHLEFLQATVVNATFEVKDTHLVA